MNRRSSPRPTFDVPTLLRHQDATIHLWGDETSGHVADRIYVSSERIHQLEITLPTGGAGFQHSDGNRTIFAADEIFYVISGEMVIANPQRGHVERAVAGEAVFFRRDTWHHAYSYGSEPLIVLEYFSPPPSQGTSSPYAKAQPYVEEWSYTADEYLGAWPMECQRYRDEASFTVIRDADLMWRLENPAGQFLVGVLASTEHLTVAKGMLLPGHVGRHAPHGGDEALYVLEGTLNIFLPEGEGQTWFELHPGDGFYIPEGVPHEYHNMLGSERATFLYGVAPTY